MSSLLSQFAGVIDLSPLPHSNANQSAVATMLAIAFGLAASIALLIIVISGFRYITAQGDPNTVAQARKGILYAIIGLVVTMAAYSIIIFVIKGVS
jgi:hypothetical protein